MTEARKLPHEAFICMTGEEYVAFRKVWHSTEVWEACRTTEEAHAFSIVSWRIRNAEYNKKGGEYYARFPLSEIPHITLLVAHYGTAHGRSVDGLLAWNVAENLLHEAMACYDGKTGYARLATDEVSTTSCPLSHVKARILPYATSFTVMREGKPCSMWERDNELLEPWQYSDAETPLRYMYCTNDGNPSLVVVLPRYKKGSARASYWKRRIYVENAIRCNGGRLRPCYAPATEREEK